MSQPSPFGLSAPRRPPGFSLIEVLLVLGIVGLMFICMVGFFLSLRREPLRPNPTPQRAASPAPKAPSVEKALPPEPASEPAPAPAPKPAPAADPAPAPDR